MKRIVVKLILSYILLLCTLGVHAQKFGYIDSDLILKKMPEYKKAETELAQLSQKWQKELDEMKIALDKMQADYRAEEVLFTDDMKKERLDTIASKERKLKEQQKKTFGFEGLLFLKKQELMKPVQDKLYDAVEKIAKSKQLQVIFDRSGDLLMIYANPIHDYTDFVLEKLGIGDANEKLENNENDK
ncbi:MAG: OmpH family outer membrane protein [Cytophagales bacterium]|nr:MAG: OmpH family outer membrane protein [Cytophagales bacterium]